MQHYQEMKRLVIVSILASFYLSETAGECPRMNEVPVMYDKETFMCACNYTNVHIYYILVSMPYIMT